MSCRPWPRATRLLLLLALALAFRPIAHAHEFRPAVLVIAPEGDAAAGVLRLTLERPPGPARTLALSLTPPPGCEADGVPAAAPANDAATVELGRWRCAGGELRGTLTIAGLVPGGVELIVRGHDHRGTAIAGFVRPDAPTWTFASETPAAGERPSHWAVAERYLAAGFEHILEGFDHLAFVLGLLLLVPGLRARVHTVTAFTVGHSITLAGSVLGGWRLPSAAVEATIAASILLLAVELARPERPTLTRRAPWAVAVGFGLLHGLGFAGALAELGLPPSARTPALLAFNLGVELGQLAVVLAYAVVIERVGARLLARAGAATSPWPRTLAIEGLGVVAAWWTITRVAGLAGALLGTSAAS